jgi:DNA-binding transcriptional MerR regulator
MMRKRLQIGEVAQLLGISTKTIRHYHKIGLMLEPERTESGYRLYDAQDLLRLKRIRHMQTFGLPLKHIKTILGDSEHEHSLREILQALDVELANQISELEERRARIHTILEEDTLTQVDQPTTLTSFEIVKGLLGERLATVTPEMLEMEKQLWMVIDEFDWPADYREHMLQIVREVAARTDLHEQMFAFNKMLAALSSLPENAPELEQFIAEYMQNKDFQAILNEIQAMLAHLPQLKGPFAEILQALIVTNISPAQQRFFAEVERRRSLIDIVTKQKGIAHARND